MSRKYKKRKSIKKSKREVYAKFSPPPFQAAIPSTGSPPSSYLRNESREYRSVGVFERNSSCEKRESPKYTGTEIIGIATLHKSNAVPVTNKKYATEISRMMN
tara:strand:+ start:4596 stop:4904 length:309 start_codon:yes stop_codon:yes gene_type:complete